MKHGKSLKTFNDFDLCQPGRTFTENVTRKHKTQALLALYTTYLILQPFRQDYKIFLFLIWLYLQLLEPRANNNLTHYLSDYDAVYSCSYSILLVDFLGILCNISFFIYLFYYQCNNLKLSI